MTPTRLAEIKARRDAAGTCKGCERANQTCHNLSDNNCVRSLVDSRPLIREIERLHIELVKREDHNAALFRRIKELQK